MPTRKQRRRREKDFRHDMRVFEVDAEGNELPLAALRTPSERKPKLAADKKQATKSGRSTRAQRVPPEPSWQRALKRGGLMGAAMLVVFVYLNRNGSPLTGVAIGALYSIAFIPLTYVIDRTAWRSYQKRIGKS